MNLWEKLKSLFKKEEIKQIEAPKKDMIQMMETGDKIEMVSKQDRFAQLHNQTNLLIDRNNKEVVNGSTLYRCHVGYKDESDMEYLDPVVREEVFINTSKEVLIDIDFGKLKNDPEYRSVLMNKLLEENRVEKMLKNGMENQPARPCGNYIGSVIRRTDGIYAKAFDSAIGKQVHNGEEYTAKREAFANRGVINKEMEKETLRRQIAENTRRLEELDGEDR